MKTMSSLQAQNRFGEMLDVSQHEPVLITRHGRPVSVVISPNGDSREAMFEFMKVVSKLTPLRGKEAATELGRVIKGMGEAARAEGLSQQDVTRMIHESL